MFRQFCAKVLKGVGAVKVVWVFPPKVAQKALKQNDAPRPVATGLLQAAEWPLEGSTTIHLEQHFPKATDSLADMELSNLGCSQALRATSLVPHFEKQRPKLPVS